MAVIQPLVGHMCMIIQACMDTRPSDYLRPCGNGTVNLTQSPGQFVIR